MKLTELKLIAKAYCKKMNYTYIFANEYKFGFEDTNGQLWTMTYTELADVLKESGR